jgi:4'-phosphopantetheinyl transferase
MIRVYSTQAATEMVQASVLEAAITAGVADLPAIKREQIMRLKPLQGRLNSLLGWRLVEFAFRRARQPNFKLSQLNFFGSGEKPRWPGGNFDFNISHSKSLVICALIENGNVGIDVEHMHPLRDTSLFARILAPTEQIAAGADMQAFFHVWTSKEAVIKAAGDGGVWDMQEVTLDGDHARYRGRTWYLYPLLTVAGYAGCVASNHIGQDVTVETVEMGQLIDMGLATGNESHVAR